MAKGGNRDTGKCIVIKQGKKDAQAQKGLRTICFKFQTGLETISLRLLGCG